MLQHAPDLEALPCGHGRKKETEFVDPLAPKTCHFPARAKNAIFLYMDGGPSHVDTFDYKPALEKYNGQDPRKVIGKLPRLNSTRSKSPQESGEFKQRGQSGAWHPSFLIWPNKK